MFWHQLGLDRQIFVLDCSAPLEPLGNECRQCRGMFNGEQLLVFSFLLDPRFWVFLAFGHPLFAGEWSGKSSK